MKKVISSVISFIQNKLALILIIGLIVYFEPGSFKENYFSYATKIDFVYKILKLIFAALIVTIYLTQKRISKMFILFLFFECLCAAATIYNQGAYSRFIGPSITALTMIAAGELIINNNAMRTVANSLLFYFRGLFCLHIISIVYVNYFNDNTMLYLLGIDNRWVFTYIPWAIFEIISFKNYNTRQSLLWLLLMEITLLYTQATTAMIIFPIIFIPIILRKNHPKLGILTTLLSLSLNLVVSSIGTTLRPIIISLGKDVTLSGRTWLWKHILESPNDKILWGHGMQTEAYDKAFFGSSLPWRLDCIYTTHAHNTLLTIIYRFGIAPLVIFISTILYAIYILLRKPMKNGSIYAFAIITCLLLGLLDTIDCAGYYLIYGFIGCYGGYIGAGKLKLKKQTFKKAVSITTLQDKTNFGNRLQLYALQAYLQELEVFPYATNYIHDSLLAVYNIKKVIKILTRKRYRNFNKFDKNITYASQYVIKGKIKAKQKFDYYITGSDQVWNTNFIDTRETSTNLLSNIETQKRISYAASFGTNEVAPEYQQLFATELKQFKAISVREERGKELVKELSGRDDAVVLIDPTMLLTAQEWDKVAKKPKQLKTDKYILCYFLGELSATRKSAIEKLAAEHDYQIINLLDKKGPFYSCGPAEFLYLEEHASLICTDSFHSSVFGFLFDRPLAIFRREDAEADMFSRLETLANTFSLQSCICEDNRLDDSFLQHDYSAGYNQLTTERKKSEVFLKKALEIDA